MEKLIALAFALLGASSCSYIRAFIHSDDLNQLKRESLLLGPEVMSFCGGWVEIWGQVGNAQPTQISIKLSPPTGKTWGIRNAHVVVEGLGDPKDVSLSSVSNFEAQGGKGKVTSWTLAADPDRVGDGLKVALRPLDGCSAGQEIKGVVIRRAADPITL